MVNQLTKILIERTEIPKNHLYGFSEMIFLCISVMFFSADGNMLLILMLKHLKLQQFFYNYSEIITIQFIACLHLELVNWNFVNNWLTV